MLRKVKPIFDSTCLPAGRDSSILGKEIFSCFLSAFLLICAFPRFNIEFFAWIGFIPLFYVLKNKSRFKGFLLSYFTGIIFWFGTIYWLVHVTFLGMVLLVLYLALYFGLFGLIIAITKNQELRFNILFLPSLWVILEYIRSHLLTGFPWALLGYSQYLNLPIIQVADITGAWGVSFMVMMVNTAIYEIIGDRLKGKGKRLKVYLLPFACLFFSLFYGYYKLFLSPFTFSLPPVRISVIQGNIPQELKWDARAKEFIIRKYLDLTAESLKDKAEFFIWPEAALPVVLEQEPEYFERVKDFVKGIGKPLLLGAVTSRDDLYYNSAVLVSSKGELFKRYDKIHLVPFGEYIPLRKMFKFLESLVPIGDFVAGKEYTVFTLKTRFLMVWESIKLSQPLKLHKEVLNPAFGGMKFLDEQASFSALICFEDVFPELSRQFVKRGANILVNITNDAWFKETSAPYQHLQSSVFRAVENRVSLVRAANTGVSAFIAPTGKINAKVSAAARDIFVDGYTTEEVFISDIGPSFYTCYGDIFVLLCVIYALAYLFFHVKELRGR